MRNEPLLSWQWNHYPEAHRDRRNLAIHIATAPLFVAGFVGLVASPFVAWWLALAGAAAMVLTVALQGRGHKLEQSPPLPFEGPLDVVKRLFVEQLITFPRFVLSGGLSRAWRGSGRP
jgi:Protein of unknown function (DUF962)